MSHQNRFLLPHQPSANPITSASASNKAYNSKDTNQENEFQVDTDFDSYWEEEARNPHRNRIRIGRQYQATVPQILKSGDKDSRKLEDLETLSFCPKRSAKVSDAELDHYFTIAKSLNLFASLVETRSLLGRDVTIADLNRIRHKEGLSLASVIQPNRVAASSGSNASPQSSQQVTVSSAGDQKSPSNVSENASASTVTKSTTSTSQDLTNQETFVPNQPLMKALSHFISLHHPCHHDTDCKKLSREAPLEPESPPPVSIKAGNLRGQGSSQTPSKSSRFRASTKQQSAASRVEETDFKEGAATDNDQLTGDNNTSSAQYDEWTREEVKLFSQAIEVCGKNFSSIKKEFLPSKSIRSIVEYYYIGSRDVSDGKRKSSQSVDAADKGCNPDKTVTNNNGGRGGSGNGGGHSPTSKGASNSNISEMNSASSATGRSHSEPIDSSRTQPETSDGDEHIHSNRSKNCSRQPKIETIAGNKSKTDHIDARMSVYNFDDDFKEENNAAHLECPRPGGAEVKPLKAKPIPPNAPDGNEAGNSNVGSLKFFMDGQLVLKLNACQEQQKCHWVQSGDKITPPRQKRYSKRAGDRMSDLSQNGSQSNSVLSSNQDEDSKNDDLTADEDSKESANSFTNSVAPRQKSQSASPNPKRSRVKTETNPSPGQNRLPSPIDYNRLAVNNRMKERTDNSHLPNNSQSITNLINNPINNSMMNNNQINNNNLNSNSLIPNNPLMNQAAMPWLQANSFAMAAALLGGLPFPQAPNNLVGGSQIANVVPSIVNLASRPMDLSVEHQAPKPIPTSAKNSSRSKSKQKNN